MLLSRPLACATFSLAVLSFAGSASAATLTLDRACYLDAGSGTQQPIVAAGGGLTPGANYSVGFSAKGKSETGFASGAADGTGALSLMMASWFGGSTSGTKVFDATVSLRDSAGTVVATADTKTSSIGISVVGRSGLRSWKVVGLAALTGGDTYYAHYFSGTKYRGRLKLGKASGPCGRYSGKRPLTPFKRIGRYDVKVTTTKNWAAGDPFIGGRVVVTRRTR